MTGWGRFMTGSDRLWLIVGGAARSGTTILGKVMSSDPGIGLLHEYPTWQFFAHVDAFFRQERRHRRGRAFEALKDGILMEKETALPLVDFLFAQKFGTGLKAVGTKTPNYYNLAEPSLPGGVAVKMIHVTRDPKSNIESLQTFLANSPIAEGHLVSDTVTHCTLQWMRAWNAAVIQQQAGLPVYHMLLDTLLAEPARVLEELEAFLGFQTDFDASDLFESPRKHGADRPYWQLASGGQVPDAFTGQQAVQDIVSDWPRSAQTAFDAGVTVGWPLAVGEQVDFGRAESAEPYKGFGLDHATRGGSFLRNGPAAVVFSLDPATRAQALRLEVELVASLGPRGGPLEVPLRLGDREQVLTARENGLTRLSFDLPAGSGEQQALHFGPLSGLAPRPTAGPGPGGKRTLQLKRMWLEAV